LGISCEIIIIDDGSQNCKDINKTVCKIHTYIELPENIGRSAIRNLFLKYAKYEYLLFLDCDSLIKRNSFLSNYADILKEKPSVVYGGWVNASEKPERKYRLRWKYAKFKEIQPCSIRQKSPYKSFRTNNFLIQKEILAETRFDERIKKYGHEDTLFSLLLKKRNISITHTDNPVSHEDMEPNSEYLSKTGEAVVNLIDILNFTKDDPDLIHEITILKFYNKVRKFEKLIDLSFVIFKPVIVFLLTKGYINLYLFDYYKLGILVECQLRKPRNAQCSK